ncbi:TRAP transporter large permease [Aurantimonas sp. C2-5-R2]|uniref:TRAP transporter large permease n=1 Tax=Aurantimonas sp. C2-5-R2 TaxID=3113713 RepID=UPI002F92DFDC
MLFMLIGLVILLMLIGLPIAFALASTTILYFFLADLPLESFTQMMAKGVDSYTLLALPFFILTGKAMNEGGATARLLHFGTAVLGHLRGGLAYANVLASFLFAGISGSAVADAGGLGAVEIETMQRAGYERRFSIALTAASSTVGPIIPPSVIMIVYGISAGVPVGALFVGGIIPGLIMALGFMGMVAYEVRTKAPKDGGSFAWKTLGKATAQALPALLTPAILVGGILAGVFTVTESGAVAAGACQRM